MTEYRRFRHPGATWFFTVNLAERRGNRLLTDRIDLLRAAFSHVKAKRVASSPYGVKRNTGFFGNGLPYDIAPYRHGFSGLEIVRFRTPYSVSLHTGYLLLAIICATNPVLCKKAIQGCFDSIGRMFNDSFDTENTKTSNPFLISKMLQLETKHPLNRQESLNSSTNNVLLNKWL